MFKSAILCLLVVCHLVVANEFIDEWKSPDTESESIYDGEKSIHDQIHDHLHQEMTNVHNQLLSRIARKKAGSERFPIDCCNTTDKSPKRKSSLFGMILSINHPKKSDKKVAIPKLAESKSLEHIASEFMKHELLKNAKKVKKLAETMAIQKPPSVGKALVPGPLAIVENKLRKTVKTPATLPGHVMGKALEHVASGPPIGKALEHHVASEVVKEHLGSAEKIGEALTEHVGKALQQHIASVEPPVHGEGGHSQGTAQGGVKLENQAGPGSGNTH